MNKKIFVIGLLGLLLLGNINAFGINITNGSTVNDQNISKTDSPMHEVYIGEVGIVWNSNQEKYDYYFSYSGGGGVYFNWTEDNIGEKIRLVVLYNVEESNKILDEEQWFFKIEKIKFDNVNHSFSIYPGEDDENSCIIYDTWGHTDSISGTIYMDFTPRREYFSSLWHTLRTYNSNKGEEINGFQIFLNMSYKKKTWFIPVDWDIAEKSFNEYLDRMIFLYRDDIPSIVNCSYTIQRKTITLDFNITDDDWNRDVESNDYGWGDKIGAVVAWGDGNGTDPDLFFGNWQIKNGQVNFSLSYDYKEKGTYIIEAIVKDWYEPLDFVDVTNCCYIMLENIKITDNEAPLTPTIIGSRSGKKGEEYTYEALATDPDGDALEYLFDWGDETDSGWQIDSIATHAWDEAGTYTIKAKARDIYGAESDWAELSVVMPKRKANSRPLFLQFLENFFEKYFNAFSTLQSILKQARI